MAYRTDSVHTHPPPRSNLFAYLHLLPSQPKRLETPPPPIKPEANSPPAPPYNNHIYRYNQYLSLNLPPSQSLSQVITSQSPSTRGGPLIPIPSPPTPKSHPVNFPYSLAPTTRLPGPNEPRFFDSGSLWQEKPHLKLATSAGLRCE